MEEVFPRSTLRIRGAGSGRFSDGVGGYPGRDESAVFSFEPRSKPGTLFVTNRRLVFIRRAIDWKEGYLAYKGRMKFNVLSDALAGVLACGGIEYCEILQDDIKGIEKDMLGWTLRVEARGRVFSVQLTRKQAKSISPLVAVNNPD